MHVKDERSVPDLMTEAPVHRSRGKTRVARALWYTAPETAEIRSERLAPAPPGWLTIRTHFTAISRGTAASSTAATRSLTMAPASTTSWCESSG